MAPIQDHLIPTVDACDLIEQNYPAIQEIRVSIIRLERSSLVALEQRRTSPGGEIGTRMPVLLQMEQLADRSGSIHFLHQNSSLVPGEKVLLNSRIDLSRVRASGI
jgi:hypothetical protein